MAATMQIQEEDERRIITYDLSSRWSGRFLWAAIIQGFGATLISLPMVMPWVKPSIAMVIASGGAGTWFTLGYVLYLVIGVIAVGLTSLFYHHFEVVMHRPYRGFANYLAWIHLVLMNVGAFAITSILMYGGYFAGAGMLPIGVGGLGWTSAQAHELLSPLVSPAGYALITTAAGVFAGGLGFFVATFRAAKS